MHGSASELPAVPRASPRTSPLPAAGLLALAALVAAAAPWPAAAATPQEVDELRGRVAAEIGAPAGGERAYRFPELTSMVLGPDGRLYVADARWSEVRAFDPDGRHAFTVDPAGEAPRVFDGPRGIFFAPDGRLWVDSRNWRDVLTFEGTQTVDRTRIERAALRGAAWPAAFAARAVGDRAVILAADPERDEEAPPVFRLVAIDPAGGVDPLHPAPILPRYSGRTMILTEPERNPRTRREIAVPFWEERRWATGPDGTVAAVVTSRYEIFRTAGDGAELSPIVGPPLEPVPVTEADREGWLEPFLRLGVAFEGLAFTEFHPPIRGIAFDEAGRLWVEITRPSGSPDRVAHVFAPDGTLVHVARWPADVALLSGSRPLLLEDRAWGLRTLPDGASQIVRIDWER